jgi:hypothetical protein
MDFFMPNHFINFLITTQIDLNSGGFEQNAVMIPFVDNPVLFSFIKTVAIIFLILFLEGLIWLLKKYNKYGKMAQTIIFIGLICGLVYTYVIVSNNVIGLLSVACQSFCPKIVTVFMSAFKSTEQVLVGESDNGDQDQSSRIL